MILGWFLIISGCFFCIYVIFEFFIFVCLFEKGIEFLSFGYVKMCI